MEEAREAALRYCDGGQEPHGDGRLVGRGDRQEDRRAGQELHDYCHALVGTHSDRMPVILAEEDWAKWLGKETAAPEELKTLLVSFKDDALTYGRSTERGSGMYATRTVKWCYHK